MAGLPRTNVEVVVEFFDPDNKRKSDSKGRKYPQFGFLFALDDGTRIPIQDEGLDPAVSPQLRKDNVFTVDIVADPTNPTRDRVKATNFRFLRAEPGAADSAKSKFRPTRSGAPTPSSSTPSDPPDKYELWRLEIYGEPVGGDKSGTWDISLELDNNNYPVEGAMLKFSAGGQRFSQETGTDGCIEKQITVAENTYGRVVCDSSLSISAIPIAGPDPVAKARPPLSGWGWANNILFYIWTAVLLVSLITGFYRTYSYVTTPASERRAQRVQTSPNTDQRPRWPWEQSPKKAVVVEERAEYIFNRLPWSNWWVLALWFIIWLLLIPICFFGEVKRSVVNLYLKSKGEIEAWRHTRKPFRYTVEVQRNNGKAVADPVYYFNGSLIDEPETRGDAWKTVKDMGWPEIKSKILRFELIAELAGVLFNRMVLDRIFK